MRRSFITAYLLLISFITSYGQWYTKEYNVPDITVLSKEQLTESLSKSKRNLLGSGAVTVAGCAVILISVYVDFSVDEDATLFEQILGEKGNRALGIGLGAGMVAGGTIAGIVYLSRIGKIKSVIKDKYPSIESMSLSPHLILNRHTGSCYPGVMFTYSF